MTPAGFLDFGPVLARAAEMMHPEAWRDARPQERYVLLRADDVGKFETTLATKAGTVAHVAYEELRPLLAAGTLPAKLRTRAGAPQSIVAESWHATAADRVLDVIAGRVPFVLSNNTTESGPVLIGEGDLGAVLVGKAAPSLAREVQAEVSSPRHERAAVKRGRPPNPDGDAFWIEACRYVYIGGLTAPLSGFVRVMADWAASNMAAPYDEQTIRKKLAGLVRALNRPDPT